VELGEGEREKENLRLPDECGTSQDNTGLGLTTHEITTWAKIESRSLNWLSHPGIPLLPIFNWVVLLLSFEFLLLCFIIIIIDKVLFLEYVLQIFSFHLWGDFLFSAFLWKNKLYQLVLSWIVILVLCVWNLPLNHSHKWFSPVFCSKTSVVLLYI